MKKFTLIEAIITCVVVLIAFSFVGMIVSGGCSRLQSEREESFTVLKTEVTHSSFSDGPIYQHFMVYTDKGVYECAGYMWSGEAPEELYGKLIPNKTYTCMVVGERAPMLSMFPQIVRVIRQH